MPMHILDLRQGPTEDCLHVEQISCAPVPNLLHGLLHCLPAYHWHTPHTQPNISSSISELLEEEEDGDW